MIWCLLLSLDKEAFVRDQEPSHDYSVVLLQARMKRVWVSGKTRQPAALHFAPKKKMYNQANSNCTRYDKTLLDVVCSVLYTL